MPALPVVLGDVNAWGTELNNYLLVGHDSGGRHMQSFNVKEYGARVDSVTDDTAAWQAAYNAAVAVGGGVIAIPPGTMCISGILKEGNGSAGTPSTQNGIRTIGAGMDATTIKWIGTVGGQMAQIAGISAGNAFADLTLDGNNSAGIGLELTSAQYGQFGELRIKNTTVACLKLDCNASGAGTNNTLGNHFSKLVLQPAAGTIGGQSHGLWLDGAAANGADSNNNSFPNLHVYAQLTYQTALRLGFCDFNTFGIVNLFMVAGTGQISILLDGSVQSGFPKNNVFEQLNCGINPTLQSNYGNNLVLHYDTSDGATALQTSGFWGFADNPNAVTTVQVPFGQGMPVNVQASTLNQQLTVTTAVNIVALSAAVDGIYEARLYLRQTNATAVTVTALVFTGDETGTKQYYFQAVAHLSTTLVGLNVASLAQDSYTCFTVPIRWAAGATQKPVIQVTASVANVVFCSASLTKVG